MKNLFAKISLFQLSDSLVQPQPQGAYVISINKIRSEQKREPHHLTYVSTLRPRYRYYILKRRISICAWFEFGANKFQDDSRSRGQVLQTHIKQIYTGHYISIRPISQMNTLYCIEYSRSLIIGVSMNVISAIPGLIMAQIIWSTRRLVKVLLGI